MRNKKMWTFFALGAAAGLATFGAVEGGVAQAQAEQQQGAEQGQGSQQGQQMQGSQQGQPGQSAQQGQECHPSAQAQVAEVLRQLHSINQGEIATGKLAEQRAQAPEIKSFASRMVKDHTNADKNLTDLAQRQNIDLNVKPTDPIVKALGQADDARDRKLHDAHGASFDVEYIAPAAVEHEVAVKIVDVGLEQAQGDVKELLQSTRGMLTMHLDLARKLEKQLSFRPSAVGGGPVEHGAKPAPGQHGVKRPQGQHGTEQQHGK